MNFRKLKINRIILNGTVKNTRNIGKKNIFECLLLESSLTNGNMSETTCICVFAVYGNTKDDNKNKAMVYISLELP